MKIGGIHSIEELLKTGRPIRKAYVKTPFHSNSLHQIIKELKSRNIPVKSVPKEKLNKLYKGNHQGIVVFTSPVHFKNLDETIEKAFKEKPYPIFLLLDGITDTRNFGAILRSALAFEVSAVIISADGSAPINEDVVRMSSGAIFHLTITRVNHLMDAVYYLKEYGVKIIAAAGNAKATLENYRFSYPVGLIMGNEQKGIRKQLLKKADARLKINISPKMESLNVSVATAIFLYEIHKQLTQI